MRDHRSKCLRVRPRIQGGLKLILEPTGSNAFKYAPQEDLDVEVGDTLQSDFFRPQVKIKRWGNECNFSLRFNLAGGQRETVATTDGGTKVVWEKGDYRAAFYHREAVGLAGGFEFELQLGRKPPSNSFSFSYTSKDVEFLYQAPLSDAESATVEVEGQQVPIRIRPANVVGSYAVYSRSRRDNRYGVGKVCHIFRPHAVDSVGNQTWGDISISTPDAAGNGTVTLSLSQGWLNSATYPVIVDPTFAYDAQGASEWFVTGNNLFMIGGTPAGSGTGDSISCYGRAWTAAEGQGALALQSNDNIVSNGYTWTYSMPTSAAWTTMAFKSTKPSISAAGHWVCAVWSYYFYLAYDSGSGDGAIDASSSYPDPPNPTDKSASANRFSLKCDYTADSPAARAKRLLLLGVN